LQKMFLEYSKPEYHSDPRGFIEKGINKWADFEKDFLVDLYNGNIEDNFMQSFPFMTLLRELYFIEKSPIKKDEISTPLQVSLHKISKYLHDYEVILPLQQIIELTKLAIKSHELSDLENLRNSLARLGTTIKKWIPYHKRDKDKGEPYYKEVKWRSLESIPYFAYKATYDEIIKSQLLKTEIKNDLEQFLKELQQLEIYEKSKYDPNTQNTIPPPTHQAFQTLHYLESYYSDIETLSYLTSCLQVLSDNIEDTKVFRLAVLRVFTILGEGIENLSPEFLACHPLLAQFKVVRNQMIHPREHASRVFKSSLESLRNKTFIQIVGGEFSRFKSMLDALIQYRKNNYVILENTLPISTTPFPLLRKISHELTRELKPTLQEREHCLSTLPQEDTNKTTEKREQLKEEIDLKQIQKTQHLLNQIVEEIEPIRILMEPCFNESDQAKAVTSFSSKKLLILACEFLLGQFLHEAGDLIGFLEQAKGYSDVRARSIFIQNPIDSLMVQLKQYLHYRNNVFHLENSYTHSHQSEILRISALYVYMEYLVLGTFYPEAIVFGQGSVKREPRRGKSLLNQLKEVQQEVGNFENKLIVWQQKRYWKFFAKKPLLPSLKAEHALWTQYEKERQEQEAAVRNKRAIVVYEAKNRCLSFSESRGCNP
jgi:uncharacterized protein with HEPN domain